jgi:hypothetical protein
MRRNGLIWSVHELHTYHGCVIFKNIFLIIERDYVKSRGLSRNFTVKNSCKFTEICKMKKWV